LAHALRVDLKVGLAAAEIAGRQAEHGLNRLPAGTPRSLWQRVLAQFSDFMILVLLGAAGVAAAMGEHTDAVVILVIVLLNAAIGLAQEWRADQAMQALRTLAVPQTMVRRDGRAQAIDTEHLVPGDVVLLDAGNLVPADLRLHQVAQLRVDESTLTGESVTVDKQSAALAALPSGTHALGDQLNMAFKGTLVTHGRAEGLVVATGASTQLGQVATLLASAEDRATPLQQRLAAFGKRLSLVVLAICALVFGLGVLRGEPPLLMALTAISLAVAAIPEALPAVVTVLLALGARRMVQVQALVRRLPAVETLGSVSTICSDKTGTLTLNRMHVEAAEAAPQMADALWQACVLCNDAQPAPPAEAGQMAATDATAAHLRWLGDPTETALLDAAELAGQSVTALRQTQPRAHEWPFDSERKRMSTLHPDGVDAVNGWLQLTKGAPETVLSHCTAQDVDAWLARAQTLAAQGLRVLAVAQRRWPAAPADKATASASDPCQLDAQQVETGLELLGLVGLIDPPRPEARAAVAECLAAGIRPVMITGDHPATALAIARQLGIVADDAMARVLSGADLQQLDDMQLAAEVGRTSVYARVDPAQKIRIVQALQAGGEYVAMTGDGVNDAPALKAADIGIAMGRNGTDVAREAAALVLLDDHFASIVAAVREGRRIYDNIRKFVRYAMAGNSGEIWTLFLAPLLGLPLPLLPIHILWINLVTDGLPGLALAAEPAERGVMQRPPRPPGESLFAHGLWQHTLWVGLLMGGLCLGVQAWALSHDNPHGQTMVFTVLTLAQMAHVLAIRSETESLWRIGLLSNRPLAAAVALTFVLQLATIYVPVLQPIFRTEALSPAELAISLGCAALVWATVELEKIWRRGR
jgi:Ca2+-transporting ATPase